MTTPLSADDQAALEGAQQRGYLVRNGPSIRGSVASQALQQAFERWSTEQLRPYILVMQRGYGGDIIISFTALTRHLQRLGRLKPGFRPALVPTEAFRATVDRIREQYVRPSPGGIDNFSLATPEFVNIDSVYLDPLVNDLLALYQQARPYFELEQEAVNEPISRVEQADGRVVYRIWSQEVNQTVLMDPYQLLDLLVYTSDNEELIRRDSRANDRLEQNKRS